jgi:hypothetical protein
MKCVLEQIGREFTVADKLNQISADPLLTAHEELTNDTAQFLVVDELCAGRRRRPCGKVADGLAFGPHI